MKSTIRRIVAACLSTGILAAASMPSIAQNSHTLPYVLPASSGAQTGFVRIVNHSNQNGTVRITAIDDTGERFGPINLSLDANEAVNFNSRDLESGNARKGLPVGAGDGSGSWRLILETALNITPLAYIRTSDGFVTAMHDVTATEAGSQQYQILFFNPGSNTRQVSRLRLINPGTSPAEIEITGRDDAGDTAPGGTVRLTLPAGGAQTLTAQTLESGGESITGRFGDGSGKWRLTVSSNVDIQIMNMLATPTGHLANLSTVPSVTIATDPTVPPEPETPTDPETPTEPETPTPEDPPCTTRNPCPRAAIPVNIQGVATGVSTGEWTDPRRHRFHVSATWDEAANAGTYAINVHYRDRLNGGFRQVNSGFFDRNRWRYDPRFEESFDTADGFPLSPGWAVRIRVCARMFPYDRAQCSGFVELRIQEGSN